MDRVEVRRGFFVQIFNKLRSVFPEVFSPTQFDNDVEKYLIPLFFMMSDQYKRIRLKSPDHRTNDTKKAGLTIAAVMAMRPISSTTYDPKDLRQFYANPLFALACATAITRRPLHAGVESERLHLYAWLDTLRWPSTKPYLADAAAQSVLEEPNLTLSTAEISQIDMIVLKLVDAVRNIDLEQKIYDLTHDP